MGRLDGIVCNNKQYWNKDKCRCECKKLVDKGVCDKGFIWNPSICKCECNKSCNIGEYLDYSNCKCKKKVSYVMLCILYLKSTHKNNKYRLIDATLTP